MIISFSGLDGSGKTTQIKLLLKYFKEKNLSIDSIYNYTKDIRYHHSSELLFFYKQFASKNVIHTRFRLNSDENNNFMKIIEYSEFDNYYLAEATALQGYLDYRKMDDYVNSPLLNDDRILIYDRYFYDEIAFKSIFGCSFNRMQEMYDNCKIPTYAFYIKISPEIAYKRNKDRDDSATTIYSNISYIAKLSNYFDQIAKRYNMITINGELSIIEIHNEMLKIINQTNDN